MDFNGVINIENVLNCLQTINHLSQEKQPEPVNEDDYVTLVNSKISVVLHVLALLLLLSCANSLTQFARILTLPETPKSLGML